MAAIAKAEVNTESSLLVDVQVACNDTGIPDVDAIQTWVELAIVASGRTLDGQTEVAVRVVDAEEISTLNGLYRQQDKPTNVLSFPAGVVDGLPKHEVSLLGDVVVCASIISGEAAAQGKQPGDHWGHMLVHGTLHLLGYDHEADSDAAEMERLEAQILAQQGIADPYASSR